MGSWSASSLPILAVQKYRPLGALVPQEKVPESSASQALRRAESLHPEDPCRPVRLPSGSRLGQSSVSSYPMPQSRGAQGVCPRLSSPPVERVQVRLPSGPRLGQGLVSSYPASQSRRMGNSRPRRPSPLVERVQGHFPSGSRRPVPASVPRLPAPGCFHRRSTPPVPVWARCVRVPRFQGRIRIFQTRSFDQETRFCPCHR